MVDGVTIYMNTKHTKALIDKYAFMRPDPADRWVFGFMCGDGWFGIIDKACAEIARELEHTFAYFHVDQIKEKFGSLRVYYSGGTEKIAAIVDDLESTANRTCEICGRPGCNKGMFVLCDGHHQQLAAGKMFENVLEELWSNDTI